MSAKPDHKSEHHAKRVTEGLKAIYGEQSDDLAFVERGRTYWQRFLNASLKWSAAVCVVVLILLMVVLRQTWFAPRDPALEISATWLSELKTGQTATLEIRYANPAARPLADLRVDFNPPPGFVISEAVPALSDVEKTIWHLGSLGRQSDGILRLTGLITVAPGTTFNSQLISTFRPANFNADFSSVTNVPGAVATGVAELQHEGPTAVLPGEQVTDKFTINTPLPVTDPASTWAIEVQPPTTYFPAPGQVLRSPDLKTEQASQEFKLIGTYASDASGSQEWRARLVQETPSGQLIHHELTWMTDVRADGLVMTLVGNGQQVDTELSRSETLRLSIRLKNTSSQPLSPQTLTLDFQPGSGVPVNWTAANLDSGVLRKEGVVFALSGVLAPGEERVFNPSFPLRTEVRAGDVEEFSVVAKLKVGERQTATTPFAVKLLDVPQLSFEAESVAGPMPPQVGQGTTYAVTLSLPATSHDLQVELAALLPPGVTYGGVTSGDWQPSFNNSTRSLSFPRRPQAKNQATSVTFTVVAVPAAIDKGGLMPLLRELTLRGFDNQAQAEFSKTFGTLTVDGP